jgi:hypothetical protein
VGAQEKEEAMSTAEDINQATEAVQAAQGLAQSAGPLVGMALQTFQQVVASNPAMLEPALKVVPEPFQSQIRSQIAPAQQKKKRAPRADPQAAKPFPWPWVIGGGVVVLGGIALIAKMKKGK